MSRGNGTLVPPQNVEAEESVLGAVLVAPTMIDRVVEEGLRAGDFYRDRHRAVWAAVLELWEDGAAIDAITVTERLREQGELEAAGGRSVVSELADRSPAAGNAPHYASIVVENARLRQLVSLGQRVSAAALRREGEAEQLLDTVERELFELGQGDVTRDVAGMSRDLEAILDEADAIRRGERRDTGPSTGFPDLDGMIGGLGAGELILVAGRPSMGKTSAALDLAEAVARQAHTVAIFSAEMSRRELVERLALSRARVPSDRWRSQRLGREDVERLVRAANELDALPVRVDDTPILGLRHLRARGRRLRAEAARAGAPLGLVIVDYLQLMAPERRGREVNRVQEVSEISRGLKVLARELEVAVLGISQLSRRCEERIDKRPHLADLRDSGSLEQDADVVLLLYRDDYYNPESDSPGICEVNVAKQRNGPTGVVELAWVGEFARCRSLHRRP